MRLVVSFVDRYIVLDGEARFVKFDGDQYEGLRGVSWDGKVGHRWFDTLANRPSEFFFDEGELQEFVELWQNTAPPEPPPLPPWEDEPELPLPLPRFAIPVVEPDMSMFDPNQPPLPWDAPPPPGFVPLDPSLQIGALPGQEPTPPEEI